MTRTLVAVLVSGLIFLALISWLSLRGISISGALADPHGGSGCGIDQPILIGVQNWTFSSIVRIDVNIELWNAGRTENLLKNTRSVRLNYIVEPFSTRTFCLGDPFFDRFIRPKPEGETSNNSLLEMVLDVNYFKERYAPFYRQAEVDVTTWQVETRTNWFRRVPDDAIR